jgi:hypothetical protein
VRFRPQVQEVLRAGVRLSARVHAMAHVPPTVWPAAPRRGRRQEPS